MPDQVRASRLAREGFDLWEAGRLEEAAQCYREALTYTDPDHCGTPDYRGEFAAVLSALGSDQESREQYELTVVETTRKAETESDIGVIIARWCLGQHLLKMRQPQEALAAVEPSLSLDPSDDMNKKTRPLRLVQAQALWQLHRTDEAKRLAQIALESASTEEEHALMREELKNILQDDDVR